MPLDLYKVEAFSKVEFSTADYDLAVFACGYEERCIAVPSKVVGCGKNVLVLGFEEGSGEPQRVSNEKFFGEKWNTSVDLASSEDDATIYKILNKRLVGLDRIRLLVDYSSMSRLWYGAILNWARHAEGAKVVEIDFIYSPGEHVDGSPPLVIKSMASIPGLEGSQNHIGHTTAIVGLGFEGSATLCVMDRMEPDEVVAFYAEPGAYSDYPAKTKLANRELIERANRTIGLPLFDVERSFKILGDYLVSKLNMSSITFVPMGPKPLTLTAMLLAFRNPGVGCIRVSGARERARPVRGLENFISARVEFRNE